MLHLFNKTYLHFDDDINLNYDRVIISKINGVPVLDLLEKTVKGKLLDFKNNFEDFNFTDLIVKLYNHGVSTNKKIIIYCDKLNYCKFMTKWLKLILPSLDLQSYQQYVKIFVYKERLISSNIEGKNDVPTTNTYWSSTELFENLNDVFNNINVSQDERTVVKNLGLNYSFEFLISSYLSGSQTYLIMLQNTVHLFLQRWFLEMFKDNRQMVLYNLLNSKFKSVLNYQYSDIDFYGSNPIKNIPSLQYYSDETMWLSDKITKNDFNYLNIKNLTQTQIDGLRNLFLKIFNQIEGIETDQSNFAIFNFLECVTRDTITKTELDSILNFVIQNPMDTLLVPKFDFPNVNLSFIHYIFNLKTNNNTAAISKFYLL